ncbi:MAG TPA: hypothetical protein VF824_16580 [Thermoanaerobaculia bacterium]|jgi:hypothetical protein
MTCDDYLEDPEANAAHLESCAACRAMTEELDGEIEVAPRVVDLAALPLAPWEGAQHRTWPLVISGLVAALVLAAVLWIATGLSPVQALASTVPSWRAIVPMLQLTGRVLGPGAVAALFVVINAILFLLLRRAPKGLDV